MSKQPGGHPPPGAPPGVYQPPPAGAPPPGAPPHGGYAPPPGGYVPPPGGYPPQGPPGGYAPPPGGYAPPPGGYAPPPGGYAPQPGAPPHGGYGPPPGAPPPGPGGYAPQPGGYAPPPYAQGGYPPPPPPGIDQPAYPPPTQPGYPQQPGAGYPQPGGPPPRGHAYPPQQGYPPQGATGGYGPQPGMPPPGAYPPGAGMMPPQAAAVGGAAGFDAEDSDGGEAIKSRHNKYPIRVRFKNTTKDKVKLIWINEKGNDKKYDKIKAGQTFTCDTFETHPWLAIGKKGIETLINGNQAFLPQKYPGSGNEVTAEIHSSHVRLENIKSPSGGGPARVKFVNHYGGTVTLMHVDPSGRRHRMKDLHPRKAWVIDSCVGYYWLACEKGHREDDLVEMNYHWFYKVVPCNPERPQKVILTRMSDSSSSSSSD